MKLGEVAKGAKVAAMRSRATILLGQIEAGKGAEVVAELSRRGVRKGVTCSELLETFAEARHGVGKWHGRTEATYRGVWARSIAPHVGKVPVASVDDADVQAIIRGCKGKRAAVAGALRLLRAVLNFAERRKLRPRGSNPVADDMIAKISAPLGAVVGRRLCPSRRGDRCGREPPRDHAARRALHPPAVSHRSAKAGGRRGEVELL